MNARRLSAGGLVDRDRPLTFRFDGAPHVGYQGDTLASALLGAGVGIVGRSFKYHRPRGVFGAGPEEPNALVELRTGARREPNTKATTVELFDGLEAKSQNRWPSLALDLMAVNGLLKPALAAGFYYKTFMWPAAFWEKVYEPIIRRAAGLGRAARLPDPDSYEHAHGFCDVLVVGAGPAGLMAATAAARAGARVILCDEDARPGGRLLAERAEIAGAAGHAWAAATAAELADMAGVRVLPRTTVVAAYDGGTYAAVERVADHLPVPPPGTPRQRFWKIVARRVVVATGAGERSLVFPGNDTPGVMLSTAVRAYLNRYAVAPGDAVVVATATDDGWRTARDLLAAGIGVAAVVDVRPEGAEGRDVADLARSVRTFAGGRIASVEGGRGVRWVAVETADGLHHVDADAVAVAGGFNPQIQLASHFRGRPVWDAAIQGFVADAPPPGMTLAGAAAGRYGLARCLADGAGAGTAAAADLGFTAATIDPPEAADEPAGLAGHWWHATRKDSGAKAFVDMQHDVTAADVVLAHREGFVSVEHLKRYTTLGMATDQGRTANVDALAIMAGLIGVPLTEMGVVLARPPVVPMAIGTVAGPDRGPRYKPVRRVPVHAWATERGAVFTDVGQWKRPAWFPRDGEADWLATATREVATVRSAVGVTDVSTLGKIEIEGPDAAAFLDRAAATTPSAIPVGRCGYLVLLREDGFLKDDGMLARLGPDRFLAFVSTVHAVTVLRHLEFCRQVLWPGLDVTLTPVTDSWAQLAVAGPRSEAVLAALVDPPTEITDTGFPPLACAEVTVCGGVPARLAALSFSGERAFEIAVPAGWGDALARRILDVGRPFGITAYGTEAMAVMRVEMGYPAGGEFNGQTTAFDLGLAPALATDKDHVGRVLSSRPALNDPSRPRLVGLVPANPDDRIRAGALVIVADGEPDPSSHLGHVTSATRSPSLNSWTALALVAGGPERLGTAVRIHDPIRGGAFRATVVAPPFVAAPTARPATMAGTSTAAAAGPHGEALVRRPPAAATVVSDGATLAVVGTRPRFVLAARRGRDADCVAAARAAFAIELPDGPRAVGADGLVWAGAGPGRWHVTAEDGDGAAAAGALRDRLDASFSGFTTIVDVSDGWVLVRCRGPRAAELLMRRMAVDLAAAAAGAVAATLLHGVGVEVVKRGADCFEIALPASYSASLFDDLAGVAPASDLA